jgi:hypothetical protein
MSWPIEFARFWKPTKAESHEATPNRAARLDDQRTTWERRVWFSGDVPTRRQVLADHAVTTWCGRVSPEPGATRITTACPACTDDRSVCRMPTRTAVGMAPTKLRLAASVHTTARCRFALRRAARLCPCRAGCGRGGRFARRLRRDPRCVRSGRDSQARGRRCGPARARRCRRRE